MKNLNLLSYFLVLILSLGAVLPLLGPGFFTMHDNTQVARVFEMAKSLNDGMFPVRWVADLGYGYGYPIFNFYAPLPYYIGAIFNLSGLDALISTKMMFIIGILLSGITMYSLVYKFFGTAAGIVSSILYMYFPYHAVNIYVRGAVGEFYGYAFLPLVFLGILNLYELSFKSSKNKIYWIFITSFSLFATIISHNLTAIMLSIILIFSIVFLTVFSKKSYKLIVSFFVTILLGLMLSAFFLLPAFFEINFTNVSSQIGGGADFKDHFVCFPQLWNSLWGFGGSQKGCLDGMSFMLGKMNVLLALFSIAGLYLGFVKNLFSDIQKKVIFLIIFLLVLSIYLITDFSRPFWDFVPIMKYIQYPWRYLNFIGLFLSVLIGVFVFTLSKINTKYSTIFSIFVITFTVFLNIKYFSPQEIVNNNSEFFTNEDKIIFETSKISDEYLPIGFQKPLKKTDLIKTDLSFQDGHFRAIEGKTGYYSFEVNNYKDKNPILFYKTFNPGWRVYFEGKELEIESYNDSFMQVNLNKGEGILEFKLKQTYIQILGNTITLIAFMIIIAVIIIKPFKNKAKQIFV